MRQHRTERRAEGAERQAFSITKGPPTEGTCQ